jgi:hypothetical protein
MAADNYLESSDYDAQLGADVVAALIEAVGHDGIDSLSKQATSFIQGFMQNSGYATPSLADMQSANTPALAVIQMAVGAALRELASAIPSISMPLPADWEKQVGKRALEGILSGDMQLVGLAQTTATSPGGWLMTSSSGVREQYRQRTSRRELRGY